MTNEEFFRESWKAIEMTVRQMAAGRLSLEAALTEIRDHHEAALLQASGGVPTELPADPRVGRA